MPIYNYTCNACGKNFDLLVGVTSKKTSLKCKSCGSKDITKSFAAFGVKVNSPKSKANSSCMDCPSSGCPRRAM